MGVLLRGLAESVCSCSLLCCVLKRSAVWMIPAVPNLIPHCCKLLWSLAIFIHLCYPSFSYISLSNDSLFSVWKSYGSAVCGLVLRQNFMSGSDAWHLGGVEGWFCLSVADMGVQEPTFWPLGSKCCYLMTVSCGKKGSSLGDAYRAKWNVPVTYTVSSMVMFLRWMVIKCFPVCFSL